MTVLLGQPDIERIVDAGAHLARLRVRDASGVVVVGQPVNAQAPIESAEVDNRVLETDVATAKRRQITFETMSIAPASLSSR